MGTDTVRSFYFTSNTRAARQKCQLKYLFFFLKTTQTLTSFTGDNYNKSLKYKAKTFKTKISPLNVDSQRYINLNILIQRRLTSDRMQQSE